MTVCGVALLLLYKRTTIEMAVQATPVEDTTLVEPKKPLTHSRSFLLLCVRKKRELHV